jgi:hypothetical protein
LGDYQTEGYVSLQSIQINRLNKIENMRVIKINTTAWNEEDFYLLTTLSDQDIAEVIMPLVNAERDGYEEYNNDLLFESLRKRFPLEYIEMYNEFDKLIF